MRGTSVGEIGEAPAGAPYYIGAELHLGLGPTTQHFFDVLMPHHWDRPPECPGAVSVTLEPVSVTLVAYFLGTSGIGGLLSAHFIGL
jgi:hypothetical protein